ncbi:hypothetical protein ABE58_18030 [Bacillus safensis]|nr:hypothetical protein [Bacillus safensis]
MMSHFYFSMKQKKPFFIILSFKKGFKNDDLTLSENGGTPTCFLDPIYAQHFLFFENDAFSFHIYGKSGCVYGDENV